MSKHTFDKMMGEWESHYKAQVMVETWGHLYPNKNYYKGTLLIAVDFYNSQNAIILDEKDLPDSSPWWYDAVTDFANERFYKAEGKVYQVEVEVRIIDCIEEISEEDMEGYRQQVEEHKGQLGWTLEEIVPEPDKWSEIHITELSQVCLVENL